MRPLNYWKRAVFLLALALAPLLSAAAATFGARQFASPSRSDLHIYGRLKGQQVVLFNGWAAKYNSERGTSLHPATVYASLSPSQRTTYEAVTHALGRSRLTGDDGRPLRRNALEMVTAIEEIAGEVKGARGDLMFRLYVSLAPDSQEILARSREFFRDKDNKVFHKGYPNNFRQKGRVPTLQISMSEGFDRADIDVDYRSSRIPAGLVNGHLRAANSDVRVGRNYFGHTGRWFGLIGWWRLISGPEPQTESQTKGAAVSPSAKSSTARAPELTSAQIAEAQEVARATDNFLRTWLINRDIKRADDYLTKRPVACINVDSDEENEVVAGRTAIKDFALMLEAGLRAKRKPSSLEEAVAAIDPWSPEEVFVAHSYQRLFALRGVPRQEAAEFTCEKSRLAGDPNAYGQFYMTYFTLRLARESGGGLALLWTKEDGQWQIVSYEVLES